MQKPPIFPLHAAVLAADLTQVEIEIAGGVKLDELDNRGQSPLHWAVMCGYIEIVKALLEAGANPNVVSSDGFTPRWSAQDFGLEEIDSLLALHDGKVMTDANFKRNSWTIFKNSLGEDLPEED